MAKDRHPARRCRMCAYVVDDMESPGACPECGCRFDFSNPATYTRKRLYVDWLLNWCIAITGGVIVVAVSAFMFRAWGPALWLGTPFAVGGMIGFLLHLRGVFIMSACLGAVITLVFTFMTMQLAGVYCGMVLTVILVGPMIVGALVGRLVRALLWKWKYARGPAVPVLFLFGSIVWAAIEGPPPNYPKERVTTERVIAAPLNAVWDSIVFYEEVTHTPPLILRIGLARPLYTRGASSAVGDVKTCVYNKGRITKQVTLVEPGRLLAFDVIEQRIGYERDVRLTGGSFAFTSIDDLRTEVALTTEYEPRLGPRFAWRPFERLAVHTLHGHVIEGMRRNAEGAADAGDD